MLGGGGRMSIPASKEGTSGLPYSFPLCITIKRHSRMILGVPLHFLGTILAMWVCGVCVCVYVCVCLCVYVCVCEGEHMTIS